MKLFIKRYLFLISIAFFLFASSSVFASDYPCASQSCPILGWVEGGSNVQISITGYDDTGVFSLRLYNASGTVWEFPCSGTPTVCSYTFSLTAENGTNIYYGEVVDEDGQASDTSPASISVVVPPETPEPDPADLVVSSISYNGSTIQATIKNEGDTDVNSPFNVALWEVDGLDYFLGYRGSKPTINSLAGSGGTQVVSFGWSGNPGQYYRLKAKADWGSAIAESDESNNELAYQIQFDDADWDVVLNDFWLNSNGKVEYCLSNVSDICGRDCPSGNPYCNCDPNPVATLNVNGTRRDPSNLHSGTILPYGDCDDSYNKGVFSWTASANTTYNIEVCLDISPKTDATPENNCMQKTLTMGPDLTVPSFGVTNDMYFKGRIENIGQSLAGSSDARLWVNGINTQTVSVSSLGADSGVWAVFDGFRAEHNTTYTLQICADATNKVNEIDETNNCLDSNPVSYTTPGLPDLEAQSHAYEYQYYPINRYAYEVSIKNVGAGPMPQTITELEITPPAGPSQKCYSNLASLGAGASRDAVFYDGNCSALSLTEYGASYDFKACADYNDQYPELDDSEDSNCISWTETTPTAPDLRLNGLVFGWDRYVYSNTYNFGESPANQVRITKFEVDGAPIPECANFSMPNIAEKSWKNSAIACWQPDQANVYYNVEVCIEDLQESNVDAENCKTGNLLSPEFPDLKVPVDEYGAPEIGFNYDGSVSAEITNSQAETKVGGFNVQLWVNNPINSPDTMQLVETQAVSSGLLDYIDSYNPPPVHEVDFNWSTNDTSLTYTFKVIVDSADEVNEGSAEGNNESIKVLAYQGASPPTAVLTCPPPLSSSEEYVFDASGSGGENIGYYRWSANEGTFDVPVYPATTTSAVATYTAPFGVISDIVHLWVYKETGEWDYAFCTIDINSNAGPNPPIPPFPPIPPDPPGPAPDSVVWENCINKGVSIPTFTWGYSDPEEDCPQTCRIKIGDHDYEEFSCSVSDCESSYESWDKNISYTLNEPQWIRENLAWDTSYNWQVQVRDEEGGWSEWADFNLTTPLHANPWPEFESDPEGDVIAGEEVVFTDISTCFDSSGNEAYCKEICSECLYDWQFGDGFTDDTVGDTSHTFTGYDDFATILSINDPALEGVCQCSMDIGVENPLPEWKETSPY